MGMATAEAQFHVLAVDDSLVDRKLIERLLKTSSYQVTTVDSGSKALEFLGWNDDAQICNSNNAQVVEVNLVITDYCMPGMTGYDLLKKMKESSNLKNIPVVIMSSENVPSRINRCLQEGAEEFFLKPVRLSDVNKLRPHMIKKAKSNPDDEENIYSGKGHFDEKPEKEEKEKEKEKEETHQPQLQLQTQASQSNKRKPIEEGLSPDRTRQRYSDLTVLSS